MELKPGTRLRSQTCSAEVIVVRPPNGEVDVRCGGAAMVPVGDDVVEQPVDAAHQSGTLLGKRYADQETGIELLCTKAGEGSLSLGDAPLLLKDAKPLPSSD
ncbi:MAG: hypothetical protein LC792_20700 [Actinobacteria bacterium]|nr:hypothetical protein [Actinomycetota bacterium]